MQNYGVTDKGFVLKRMDTILEEIHSDLTSGYGFDTRVLGTSFLNTLVTTFAGQVADLWETAQESYYAKYPATASGVNLDNAVQYGGVRRKPASPTRFPLHCTGADGTYVRERINVATKTQPEIKLYNAAGFEITRAHCNMAEIKVAVLQNSEYSVTINDVAYRYKNSNGVEGDILKGLADAMKESNFDAVYKPEEGLLSIQDKEKGRSNALVLSPNLTTSSVTSIVDFYTEELGKIELPYGIVTVIVNNIPGFTRVANLVAPVYGRMEESDIELRASYINKSALRSNTMIDSIISEILNNVSDIESASGYENDSDHTNSRGLPPHSVEIVVEGGDKKCYL